MKKNLLKKLSAFIVTALLFSASAKAQNVNIPDALFKSRLVNNPAINTNGDSEIQVAEATAYNGFMNVATIVGPGIWDLTGIEAFTAITGLNCFHSFFSSLDLSYNTALTYLDCSGCIHLTSLNVSANTALDTLLCYGNDLTSLDVSSNTALVYFYCSFNQITSIDVSANTALTDLHCVDNQLTSLDVSSNTALVYLDCSYNHITSIDVSANTALNHLNCFENQLTSLDVSTNTALTVFYCDYNQLTSLNVQNGFNTNITDFDATSNPNLTCIQVDNVAYSNANWSAYKDAAASFSTNCGVTSVTDIGNLSNVQIAPNPATNHVTIDLPNTKEKVEVTIADITGKIIYKTIATDVNKLEVNTTDFAKGIYVVQIQTADFIATKKLVIEK